MPITECPLLVRRFGDLSIHLILLSICLFVCLFMAQHSSPRARPPPPPSPRLPRLRKVTEHNTEALITASRYAFVGSPRRRIRNPLTPYVSSTYQSRSHVSCVCPRTDEEEEEKSQNVRQQQQRSSSRPLVQHPASKLQLRELQNSERPCPFILIPTSVGYRTPSQTRQPMSQKPPPVLGLNPCPSRWAPQALKGSRCVCLTGRPSSRQIRFLLSSSVDLCSPLTHFVSISGSASFCCPQYGVSKYSQTPPTMHARPTKELQ